MNKSKRLSLVGLLLASTIGGSTTLGLTSCSVNSTEPNDQEGFFTFVTYDNTAKVTLNFAQIIGVEFENLDNKYGYLNVYPTNSSTPTKYLVHIGVARSCIRAGDTGKGVNPIRE